MKSILTILPVLAVIAAIGGAIYYVQSNAPAYAGPAEEEVVPTASSGGAPVSDRYSVGG